LDSASRKQLEAAEVATWNPVQTEEEIDNTMVVVKVQPTNQGIIAVQIPLQDKNLSMFDLVDANESKKAVEAVIKVSRLVDSDAGALAVLDNPLQGSKRKEPAPGPKVTAILAKVKGDKRLKTSTLKPATSEDKT
jgi:hypothetical protein